MNPAVLPNSAHDPLSNSAELTPSLPSTPEFLTSVSFSVGSAEGVDASTIYATSMDIQLTSATLASRSQVAKAQYLADIYKAQVVAKSNREQSIRESAAQVYAAELRAAADCYVADAQAKASNYRADQDLESVRIRNEELQTAEAARIRDAGQTSRFNARLGWMKPTFSDLERSATAAEIAGFAGPTGKTTASGLSLDAMARPYLADVLTPEDVEAMVNSARARTDARVEADIARTRSGLAARGLSGSTPLLAQLTAQLRASGIASNVEATVSARTSAAKINAEQRAAATEQAVAWYKARNDAAIESAKLDTQRLNTYLDAAARIAAGMGGSD